MPTSCTTPGPATRASGAPICRATCSASRGSICPARRTATASSPARPITSRRSTGRSSCVEGSRIVEINAGGEFGDKLRKLKAETDHLSYPGFPGKGLFYWWEASIGTNPHIHRPRKGFPSGWVNCLYERVRSGVIHIGFGTIISSMNERRAAKAGLPVGHWHLHLYFPTVRLEREGDNETDHRGRPAARARRSRHPQACRQARRRRSVAAGKLDPGGARASTCAGDYWQHYAKDPLAWVKAELNICRELAPPVHADGRRRSEILPRQQRFLDDRRRRHRPAPCASARPCARTRRRLLRIEPAVRSVSTATRF